MTELEAVNCPRTLQTVQGWLADDSMIGPQTKADLEAIAYAVGDQRLLDDVPCLGRDSCSAGRTSECRSASVTDSPGKTPATPRGNSEGRTRIEIDNATSAWVVQVESISDRAELRPRSYVNAVLSMTDDFLRYFRWRR